MIDYTRHEPMDGPSFQVTADLAHFILDVPYLMYFGVIPSRNAINQRLLSGGGHGGMSPGAEWDPFTISEEEYAEVVVYWESMDIRAELAAGKFRYDPRRFLEDEDILKEDDHLEYLRKSREKHEATFMK